MSSSAVDGSATTESATTESAARAWAQWRHDRHAFVTSQQGPLALVLTQWQPAGQPALSDEEARAGQPVDALLTRLVRDDIDTGEPQQGHRIWRQDSPANIAFEAIEDYPYDPAWVIDGRFELVDEQRVVPFEHIKDGGATRALPVSGDLVFTLDGVEHRFAAFDTVYGGTAKLQLVFGDTTNGAESYGAGRFLFLERPATDGAHRAGDTIPISIDFNRAIVPPCGFSNQMNCPLPPLQNRLRVPVRAGEKRVRYADGFEL